MKPPRIKPWWCDCDCGGGYDDEHPPECYGNSPAWPRLTEATKIPLTRDKES